MKARIWAFCTFLCCFFVGLSLIGCAPYLSLEVLAAQNSRAIATRVCRRHPLVGNDVTFWAEDTTSHKIVTDSNPEALKSFASIADFIYQYDPEADPEGTRMFVWPYFHLSCQSDVTIGRPLSDDPMELPITSQMRQALGEILAQGCAIPEQASIAGGNFMGQRVMTLPPHPGEFTHDQVKQVAQMLVDALRRPAPPPDESHRIPPAIRRPDAVDHPATQAAGGFAAGLAAGAVPGGAIGSQVLIESGALPPGTREARLGKAIGEMVMGGSQFVVGCAGSVGGGGAVLSGAGAPVGAAVLVGTVPMAINGGMTFCNGTRTCILELWRVDDSQAPTVTTPPPASGMSRPAAPPPPPPPPKPAAAPPQVAQPPTATRTVTHNKTTGVTKSQSASGTRSTTKGKPSQSGKGAKRGPKTDESAPHNAAIKKEGDKLRAEGNTIVNGGRVKPERLVETPGGKKSGRRPDIIYRKPGEPQRGRNVGKTNADGTPVKREREALDDLNKHSDTPTDFVPYDR